MGCDIRETFVSDKTSKNLMVGWPFLLFLLNVSILTYLSTDNSIIYGGGGDRLNESFVFEIEDGSVVNLE